MGTMPGGDGDPLSSPMGTLWPIGDGDHLIGDHLIGDHLIGDHLIGDHLIGDPRPTGTGRDGDPLS
jgi:hypothetical protein